MLKKSNLPDSKFQIIDIQTNNQLTIAQIKYCPQDSFHFISLSEAVSLNDITIKEVSESGDVNKVLIINDSEDSVFIMDGDLLKGAKQNRVLNSSILLAPKSESIAPVSCVERGRWNDISSSFSPSDEIATKNIRMDKHDDIYMKGNVQYDKHSVSQSKVWDNVSLSARLLGVDGCSPTESHSDMFNYKRNDFRKHVQSFNANNKANGLAYFIDNKLMGCEFFNRRSIYLNYFDKILTTIGTELHSFNYKKNTWTSFFNRDTSLSFDQVYDILYSTFIDFDNNIKDVDTCKGIALGDEKRYRDQYNMFYELVFDGHMIHKSLLVAS